ncbi:MAG: hypothetical protein JKY43_03840 [Phycisphaerales bacterium]|nr:hypothetical protein [Phycisphaerales bacterium]
MNDKNNNSNTNPNADLDAGLDTGLDTENLCIAAMLRACADGELCPEQCDRLKQYLAEHPEAAEQVEFEKTLKKSCERIMGSGCGCPNSLRAKIEAMACECMAASGIDESNKRTRKASFWRLSPMMSAMAAVLALAGGALIWQSASIITQGSGLGFTDTSPVAYAERVGNFVAREHMRCCDEKAASQKLIHNEITESIAYFSERFNQQVASPSTISDQANIQYYGGGDCNIPATDKSGHLRFDAVGPDGETISLSLFIAPDPGLLGLEEGVTYMLDSTQCREQGTSLFAWVADGIMYLLVSEAKEDMCAEVRGMMNAPTKLRQL